MLNQQLRDRQQLEAVMEPLTTQLTTAIVARQKADGALVDLQFQVQKLQTELRDVTAAAATAFARGQAEGTESQRAGRARQQQLATQCTAVQGDLR